MTASKNILALIGANGMLAQAVRNLAPEDYEVVPFDLPDFDLTDRAAVSGALLSVRPQVIINCAAYTQVDGCESDEILAMRVNGEGPGYLAEAAKALEATLVHISTDYVFDGRKRSPYVEEDATRPQSAYGRSKLAGEKAILEGGLRRYFIVRTSWLYGPGGKNFVETIIRLAEERESLGIVADQVGTPTYTRDLARAIFELLELRPEFASDSRVNPYGIYHFSNEGQCSWYDFAVEIARLAKEQGSELRVREIRPIATEDYPLPATRPSYSVFSKDKIKSLIDLSIPHWKTSLAEYMALRTTRGGY